MQSKRCAAYNHNQKTTPNTLHGLVEFIFILIPRFIVTLLTVGLSTGLMTKNDERIQMMKNDDMLQEPLRVGILVVRKMKCMRGFLKVRWCVKERRIQDVKK